MNRKGFAPLIIIGIIAAVAIAGALGYSALKHKILSDPNAQIPSHSIAGPGEICGELGGSTCATGYFCKPNANDSGGICVANAAAKKTDTSAWQTYSNQQFGFEVKYPRPEVKVSINEDAYPTGTRVVFPSNNFSIIIDSSYHGKFEDYKYFSNSTTTTSDGYKVYVLKSDSVPFIAFAKENAGRVYIIEFLGDTKISAQKSQILSTFKFIQ